MDKALRRLCLFELFLRFPGEMVPHGFCSFAVEFLSLSNPKLQPQQEQFYLLCATFDLYLPVFVFAEIFKRMFLPLRMLMSISVQTFFLLLIMSRRLAYITWPVSIETYQTMVISAPLPTDSSCCSYQFSTVFIP